MENLDRNLWDAVQKGNQSAFEQIYLKCAHKLYFEVSKRIVDQDAVQDIIQDIFLTLWDRREHYYPKGDLYPYLYGMAMNRVLNFYRNHKKQPVIYEIWEQMPENMMGLEELSSAFKYAHTLELETLLDLAIAQLPKRMREVYQLKFVEQKSVSEIANALRTSPHTVSNQLKEIRKRFVKMLKETSYFFF